MDSAQQAIETGGDALLWQVGAGGLLAIIMVKVVLDFMGKFITKRRNGESGVDLRDIKHQLDKNEAVVKSIYERVKQLQQD